MTDTELILLTRSLKKKDARGRQGYCVAGIDAATGAWLRLVSRDEETGGSLFDEDTLCRNGRRARVLDRVRVPVLEPRPGTYQRENLLAAPGRRWDFLGRVTLTQALALHPPEEPGHIFADGRHYLQEAQMRESPATLCLAEARDVALYRDERGKAKARFVYRDTVYDRVSLTDPERYDDARDQIVFPRALLVCSLPDEPWQERYYKFIARLFPLR